MSSSNVAFRTNNIATVGTNILVIGAHHHEESSHDLRDWFMDTVTPDIVAHESHPIAFSMQQIQRPNVDSLHVLEYVVRSDSELALIDTDWDDVYRKYPQPKIDEILTEVEEAVGANHIEDVHTSLETTAKEREIMHQRYPDFAVEFHVKREIMMARHIAWIAERYDNILVTIGHAHLESLVGIIEDIMFGDNAGFSPKKPPIYTATELHEIVADKNDIISNIDSFKENNPERATEAQILKLRYDLLEEDYKKAIQSLSQPSK